MPIYEYECMEHGRFEVFKARIGNGPREHLPCPRPQCGREMDLAVSVPRLDKAALGDWRAGLSQERVASDALGRDFKNQRAMEKYCKEKGFEVSNSRETIMQAKRAREVKTAIEDTTRRDVVGNFIRDYMV